LCGAQHRRGSAAGHYPPPDPTSRGSRLASIYYEGLVRLRAGFCGKIDALGQNPPQSGPKCQGGGGITAYVVRPHAPDGAPTVGTARISRGAMLERRAATCVLQNPLRPEWFNSVFGCLGFFWRRLRP
jgi:hypothetical protein